MERTNKKEKWTLMKYVKDFNLILDYADLLRELKAKVDTGSIIEINKIMEQLNIYVPRYGVPSVDTTNFKICQIIYYMFAYRADDSTNKELVFSPLGNLLLDHRNEPEKVAKIFLTMMYNMPFNHPYNKMSSAFNLYPFRLMFKLLMDDRLGGKLYCDEMFYLVEWIKEISETQYETLVKNILKLRKQDTTQKYKLFCENLPTEDALANALHETCYLFGHLAGAGIAQHIDVPKDEYIGALHHGGFGRGAIPFHLDSTSLQQHNRSTRNYRMNYIVLNDTMKPLLHKLLEKYPYTSHPHDLLKEFGSRDYILYHYNFYPQELLEEIGVYNQERIMAILHLTENIITLSKNTKTGDCYRFEDILCNAFNEFKDVQAEKVAKAGTTDVECIYLTINEKFDLEAKSTGHKLSSISAGRLKEHRNKIQSKYTIIVVPSYVPSVLYDIKGTENVILTAHSLSNYLYQASLQTTNEGISYKPIYDIIQSKIGTDISQSVNEYVAHSYGIGHAAEN